MPIDQSAIFFLRARYGRVTPDWSNRLQLLARTPQITVEQTRAEESVSSGIWTIKTTVRDVYWSRLNALRQNCAKVVVLEGVFCDEGLAASFWFQWRQSFCGEPIIDTNDPFVVTMALNGHCNSYSRIVHAEDACWRFEVTIQTTERRGGVIGGRENLVRRYPLIEDIFSFTTMEKHLFSTTVGQRMCYCLFGKHTLCCGPQSSPFASRRFWMQSVFVVDGETVWLNDLKRWLG